jgi:Zn-dependent membrane protease YugP
MSQSKERFGGTRTVLAAAAETLVSASEMTVERLRRA